MRQESLTFFKDIVNTPSPSGYEMRAAEVYRNYTNRYADEVTTDVMGNTYAVLNPKAKRIIMLAGHMDEIGFAIHYVSDEGLCYFHGIGGHDSVIPVGQRVWIHGAKGKRVPGVIGRKAIHLLTQEERAKKPEMHELWIDIGVSSKKDALKLIEIGDVATYQWEFQELASGVASARGFDNKMGSFIVAEALRLTAGKLHKDVGVVAVATVQEEIGLRGAKTSAARLGAEVGIAVDVTHATDYPSVEKRKEGDLKMGAGPVVARGANINHVVFEMILAAAKEEKIACQIEVEAGGTGTDANAMQVTGPGMATGLLGVPIRYMHTPVETLCLKDVENCAKLMAAFCAKVTTKTDFTPRPL